MKRYKFISSPGYNRVFDRETGFFARWGNTKEDNPKMSPVGPEIADIEISTVCNGIGKDMNSRVPCSWCYKSNTGSGTNMTFETYSSILMRLKEIWTDQVALGVGDINGNPDLWRIMEFTRANDVIPNITVNGMGITPEIASRLTGVCGAVAVSHYIDDLCFDAVNQLHQAKLNEKVLVRVPKQKQTSTQND